MTATAMTLPDLQVLVGPDVIEDLFFNTQHDNYDALDFGEVGASGPEARAAVEADAKSFLRMLGLSEQDASEVTPSLADRFFARL